MSYRLPGSFRPSGGFRLPHSYGQSDSYPLCALPHCSGRWRGRARDKRRSVDQQGAMKEGADDTRPSFTEQYTRL